MATAGTMVIVLKDCPASQTAVVFSEGSPIETNSLNLIAVAWNSEESRKKVPMFLLN